MLLLHFPSAARNQFVTMHADSKSLLVHNRSSYHECFLIISNKFETTYVIFKQIIACFFFSLSYRGLQEKGIGVINASPFGMGLLTPNGPQPWIPAQPHIQEACRKAAEYCQSKGVNIAKLALYFSLSQSHDIIPITVTGTAKAEEMKINVDTACGSLSSLEHETMEYVLEE